MFSLVSARAEYYFDAMHTTRFRVLSTAMIRAHPHRSNRPTARRAWSEVSE